MKAKNIHESHNVKQRKSDTEESIPHDSLYIKF